MKDEPKLILPGGVIGESQYDITDPGTLEEQDNPINYDRYDTIDELYWEALLQFSLMLSRDLPEQFRGHDKRHTEHLSNEAGIIAYGRCIIILEKKLQGIPFIAKLDEYYLESLENWYERQIIIFVAGFTDEVPEKFHKNTDKKTEKHSTKVMIRTFKRGITNLKHDIAGQPYE